MISENFQRHSCFLPLEEVFWKFPKTFVFYCGFGSDVFRAWRIVLRNLERSAIYCRWPFINIRFVIPDDFIVTFIVQYQTQYNDVRRYNNLTYKSFSPNHSIIDCVSCQLRNFLLQEIWLEDSDAYTRLDFSVRSRKTRKCTEVA